MRSTKRRGSVLVSFLLIILLVTVIAFGAGKAGAGKVTALEADMIKAQTRAIDNSLAMYYRFYGKRYPVQLSDLQTAWLYPRHIDLARFTYTSSDTAYRLRANLPGGGTYDSPGSKL